MAENEIHILDDQPIENAKFFNFDAYAEALDGIITCEKTETPIVIGIFGDWGSGKTSLMRTLEKKIKNYLFSWEELIDSGSGLFQKFLQKEYGIEWIEPPEIKKESSENTLIISSGNNSALLELNDNKTRATLTIDRGEPVEFIVESKNGKHEMYKNELKGHLTIWFNAWKYNKEDAIWRALLTRILKE